MSALLRFAAAFTLAPPTGGCACRCVPRATVASRTAARGGGAGSSNGVWRRMAIHASDAWRWMAVHACAGVWRWRAVHASESVCRPIAAARPATRNAQAAPNAMRRKARPPRNLARSALTAPGRLNAPTGFADAGLEVVPASVGLVGARQGGSDGRRRRHAAQTPRSPGAASYRAPQLVHPSTEAGVFVFMPPMYRGAGLRFSANQCDGATPLPTVPDHVVVTHRPTGGSRASTHSAVGDRFLAEQRDSRASCPLRVLAGRSSLHTRGDMSDAKSQRVGRERIARVFRYLKALNEHRNPAKRDLSEQPWALWFRNLPDHPSIQRRVLNGKDAEEDDFVLKVGRPTFTQAPPPPLPIVEWLEGDWEDPEAEVLLVEAKGDVGSEPIRFDSEPRRVEAYERWRNQHDAWAATERPARATMRIFEQLYELYGRIEREAESIELVLGDGILSWKKLDGSIYHPILLQRIHLAFNPSVPEFTLIETGREVELYSALFRSMPDIEPKVLARCREELDRGGFHPLGGNETLEFFRRFVVQLSPRGQFAEGPPEKEAEDPKIGRAQVLFLRTRTLGFATAIEGTLDDLATREDLPLALLKIVGLDPPPKEDEQAETFEPGDEPEEVLLSKPANPEQIRIAVRLEREGCVLVQGPPGTGKTHTIANLIGHLLAQGQSVLVTSHTTKALRVLRDHVVEKLRPLTVSVLESDIESRAQLESAVSTIIDRLTTGNPKKLDAEAEQLAVQRKELLAQLRKHRQELFEARADEYRDVVFLKTKLSPCDAARKVAAEAEANGWIPAPVQAGAALPLSAAEVKELYASTAALSREDEAELARPLPEASALLSPGEFERAAQERHRLSSAQRKYRKELWRAPLDEPATAALDKVLAKAVKAVEVLDREQPWKIAAVVAGKEGGTQRTEWDGLLETIDQFLEETARAKESALKHAPRISEGIPLEEQLQVLDEMLAHAKDGKSLGKIALLTHGSWKRFITESRVASGEPKTVVHFQALRAQVALRIMRRDLEGRWDRQMVPQSAPAWAKLSEKPHEAAAQIAKQIRRCLAWHAEEWEPIEKELEEDGFCWREFLAEQKGADSTEGLLHRLKEVAGVLLPAAFQARKDM